MPCQSVQEVFRVLVGPRLATLAAGVQMERHAQHFPCKEGLHFKCLQSGLSLFSALEDAVGP